MKFLNMFKVPDLRNKIIFTLFVILLYRFGDHIYVPGVDVQAVQRLTDQAAKGGVLGFLNLFSGGGLTRLAVFGLGIMPYITSSIIIQLLGVVIPKLEQWRDQGAVGQKKITQATRYLTIALAIMQSTGLAFVFHRGGQGFLGGSGQLDVDVLPHFTVPRVLLVVLSLTAGTAMVMWLGELITQRGIGQGMSILIFTNVVSRMPAQLASIRAQAGWFTFGLVCVMGIGMIVAIVFVEQGQRRIPVQFAKRVVGRRMYGGQSTYIPLKVNQAGVIPIIFASSVLYFPVMLSSVLQNFKPVFNFVNKHLVSPSDPLYIAIYGLLIIFFTYFYTAITFDPHQQADIIRKQGGFIPGIRPGPPTERYLAQILNRITLPGSLFLAAIAILPQIALAVKKLNSFPFGGTTILIAVGVALETMKQIDSQLMMRNYEGFLK
jgi:preprotein translocase subunit SecY